MPSMTLEEKERVEQIENHLKQLADVTAENIMSVIHSFLSFLQEPKNSAILKHVDLYPYLALFIQKHSAILKNLGLIHSECVFEGGTTPFMQLVGIYKVALFPNEDLNAIALHGNLQTATILAQKYREQLCEASTEGLESLVKAINQSVFSDPTVLQAKGFFLAAQLYYQISQQYLHLEKNNPNKLSSGNAFKYFQKAISYYTIARHLLRAGYANASMPLVADEKNYPDKEDEAMFIQYVTDKVTLFKGLSGVSLNCEAVARQANLQAKSCAHVYTVRKQSAAKTAIPGNLHDILQNIVNTPKPASVISYPGAQFPRAQNTAPVNPSYPAACGPKPG